MTYNERVAEAINYSRSLGLRVDDFSFPFVGKLDRGEKQKIFQFSADALYHHGYQVSSDLAGMCIPVHLMLQYHLKYALGVESSITIGDRFWHDYIYCELTRDSVEKELQAAREEKPIKAHVWLTLTDGTILDCTGEAHADVLFKRGDHMAHKCIMIVEANKNESAEAGYHRPVVVGRDFLERTGMVRMV